MSNQRIAVLSAVRTAIGRFGGSLSEVSPLDLGARVATAAIERAGVATETVERLVLGENIQLTKGGNPARHVLLRAGLAVDSDDYSVNMNCASGLRAMTCLASDILLGEVQAGLAVGTENMSATPYLLEGARFGYRLGNKVAVDFLADYILGDAGPMAETVAAKFGISRLRQDQFAVRSQARAGAAIESGLFAEQIVPVEVSAKGGARMFETDEHPRPGVTLDALARLSPVFESDGTVTAGNSSGINDGAAAVMLMREEAAASAGLTPLGFLSSWASAGVEPNLFGMGPVPAVSKLLGRADLKLAEIALIELNEAFASSSQAVIDELGLDDDLVNVNGGAIALGHPVGATGIVLTTKLLFEMRRRGVQRGLVTMCVGSGQGMAVLLELE
jgi:acetyl-CoA C-acetyltransferase